MKMESKDRQFDGRIDNEERQKERKIRGIDGSEEVSEKVMKGKLKEGNEERKERRRELRKKGKREKERERLQAYISNTQ